MATCNRVECFHSPEAQLALKLIDAEPRRYAITDNCVGVFWIPQDPETDLLQVDMADRYLII